MWRTDERYGLVWDLADGPMESLGDSAFFTTDSAPTKCLEFRALRKASLLGFATVQFGSGLVMSDISVHQNGSRCWASPPARPMLDKDGAAIREETGKIKYASVIRFSNHGVQRRFSDEVLKAIRAAYPEAIPEPEEDASLWARRRP